MARTPEELRAYKRDWARRKRYQLLCFNCNWAKHALGACGCQGARLREVG